jgi:predicted secreted protein
MKINAKKLIQQINPQLSTDLSKKISNYLEENMGDVQMTGGIKDGMMQGSTTMSITGNHTNSLEFFFNMIDAINDIMEKDKLEREKKVD